MHAAYLLFDLAVISGPVALAQLPGPTRWRRQLAGLLALVVGGVPWVLWDVLVAGHHWDFNPRYVLGPRVLGLPLEEWGFFLVVPFACLYSWEALLKGPSSTRWPALRWVRGIGAAMSVLGLLLLLVRGVDYTGLATVSLGLPFVLDGLWGRGVFLEPRSWAWMGLVGVLTFLFDNVLTGLPIVTYMAEAQLDLRLLTMPVEDLGFGLGHLGVVLVCYEALVRRGPGAEGVPDEEGAA